MEQKTTKKPAKISAEKPHRFEPNPYFR